MGHLFNLLSVEEHEMRQPRRKKLLHVLGPRARKETVFLAIAPHSEAFGNAILGEPPFATNPVSHERAALLHRELQFHGCDCTRRGVAMNRTREEGIVGVSLLRKVGSLSVECQLNGIEQRGFARTIQAMNHHHRPVYAVGREVNGLMSNEGAVICERNLLKRHSAPPHLQCRPRCHLSPSEGHPLRDAAAGGRRGRLPLTSSWSS